MNELRCVGEKMRRGAGQSHLTVTGGAPTTGIEFKTDGVRYFQEGTLKFTVTGKANLQPDGSVTTTGDVTITDGTRVFRDATGKGKLSGSSPVLGGVTTGEVNVTISY